MIDEKKLIGFINSKEFQMRAIRSPKSVQEILCEFIEEQPKIGGWIPCSERLPEEYDSMFAKFKGTEKWDSAMFEKISDDVNVTVEFENGKRKTKTLHTVDGKWNGGQRGVKFKVIAWQPLPEEYQG